MLLLIMPEIYLSRHGESLYNKEDRLGGDPDLSDNGKKYSILLSEYVNNNNFDLVITSGLKRTINTSKYIKCEKMTFPFLNEINAGICENLTYEEVKKKYPEEFLKRKENKFIYRYPEGESYKDLVERVKPIIEIIKKQKEKVLIIAHQAVLRVIIGLLSKDREENIPYISVPLHTVIKIKFTGYEYEEKRIKL